MEYKESSSVPVADSWYLSAFFPPFGFFFFFLNDLSPLLVLLGGSKSKFPALLWPRGRSVPKLRQRSC